MSRSVVDGEHKCPLCDAEFSEIGTYRFHFSDKHQHAPWRDERTLTELYVEKGFTLEEVANKLGCATSTISKWMEKLGIERRSVSEAQEGNLLGDYGVTKRQKEKLNDREWLIKNYIKRKRPMADIAAELDCSKRPVKNALNYFDIQIRSCNSDVYKGPKPHLSDYPKLYNEEWLYEEFISKNRSLKNISKELGCSSTAVYTATQRFNIRKDISKVYCGEAHWNYKGGEQKYGSNWLRKRREALERDSYECRACSICAEGHKQKHGEGLHVHHITPIRKFDQPEQANRLSNLMTICRDCHYKWEGIPLKPDRRE